MTQKLFIPQELKDATIVPLYKRKDNRQSYDNHRGISLLAIAGKILARVLLNRLIDHLENGPPTRNSVQCQEQLQLLYATFVDLTKAFNTASREGLWRIMEKFGCPAKFITMVRQFHDGMQARGLDNGNCSEAFSVTNCVKQGCVLAPPVFSMVVTAVLSNAFYDDHGTCIGCKYKTDGGLCNGSRFQVKSKAEKDLVRDFLFADDCALNDATETKMEQSMTRNAASCRDFGLTISTRKTEVMFQPAPQPNSETSYHC